jgi:cytochrome P450
MPEPAPSGAPPAGRQRRTLQPLFTPRRVTRYTELMAAEAARVVAVEPGEVDLHAPMQRYALRVVGRALFGEDLDDPNGS